MTNDELQQLLFAYQRNAQITVELLDGREIAVVGLDWRVPVNVRGTESNPRLCLLTRVSAGGWEDE